MHCEECAGAADAAELAVFRLVSIVSVQVGRREALDQMQFDVHGLCLLGLGLVFIGRAAPESAYLALLLRV